MSFISSNEMEGKVWWIMSKNTEWVMRLTWNFRYNHRDFHNTKINEWDGINRINDELTQTATSRPTSSTKYRQPWATPKVDREAQERITVRNPLAKWNRTDVFSEEKWIETFYHRMYHNFLWPFSYTYDLEHRIPNWNNRLGHFSSHRICQRPDKIHLLRYCTDNIEFHPLKIKEKIEDFEDFQWIYLECLE